MANFTSAAAFNYWTQAGRRALVLPAAAAAAVHTLAKLTSVGGVAGATAIGTADRTGLAIGAYLDAPSGAGVNVRVALPGQRQTLISDGSTAIAIGDPLTSNGAIAAGQVLKAASTGTTPIIGTAMTVAASGGGAVAVDAFVQHGEA